MPTTKPTIYLIGGAPGAGKTTLGMALAAKLGIASLSIDDLLSAAQAVTTPESHPGLHVMRRLPSLEYFTTSTIAQLKADATTQHQAVWPMVSRVIHKHAASGSRIVIDGWHLRPNWVANLELRNVWSGWIVPSAEVLQAREEKIAWYQQSTDPTRMLANFLARSLWYNALIKEQASQQHMMILPQPGHNTVEQLCHMIISDLA